MVHALTEAHRVLKPSGLLIDMRPAAKHRRAGLGEADGQEQKRNRDRDEKSFAESLMKFHN